MYLFFYTNFHHTIFLRRSFLRLFSPTCDLCMSTLIYTRCIGEITCLSNRPTPSRKVCAATANKMAAWKRDKVLSFLARRIKQS